MIPLRVLLALAGAGLTAGPPSGIPVPMNPGGLIMTKQAAGKSPTSRMCSLLLFLLIAGCTDQPQPAEQAQAADILFFGEHIITMDGSTAEAVAVRGSNIMAVGSTTELSPLQGADTRVINLGDRALLPGFIDAHGHFSAVARYQELLDLSSPPVGTINDIADIIAAIRNWISEEELPPGSGVFAFGYDDSLLAEQRHPTRDDLDQASTEHPIIIRHVSGHLLVANTVALEQANVTSNTPDPQGGIIRRRNGSQEPDGVMEETAMGLFPSSSADLTQERYETLRRQTMELYASYGITTIQDSNIGSDYAAELQRDADANPFPQDFVAFIMANPLADSELAQVSHATSYQNGFRVGGVKFTLDGSPQGRTAWMSQPYTAGPPNASPDYVAYPSYAPGAYMQRMPRLLERGIPVLVHANGDAAIELMIEGVAAGVAAGATNHRSVIIHAQLIRPDQLERARTLGIIPSFYSVHPFFWGDWHRLSFGDERASFISPVAAAAELEIPYTMHNDSPIVPPDMMRLLSITVNRITRSGIVLGPDHRASVMQALRGLTSFAAYQYFEEDRKGSITPGKQADLVILAANPLLVDPTTLQDIAVEETFARGFSVYRRQD